MPSTHSSTRVEHKGPRHPSDPDRRVKWVLRFKRRGDEVTPERVVVRRHRRSSELPQPVRSRRARRARRRERHHVAEQLAQQAREVNAELDRNPI